AAELMDEHAAGRFVDALGRRRMEHGADAVGLLRVAHKTITLVQPQAFPFAPRHARSRALEQQ
ncbi:MAG: hypothetical protein QOD51_3052, partial [Candidatus Eremiobacteraeota bacterium]|nr:hypothetical protein [Candidatus Eremiobacteraeota bacterium]